MCMRLESMSVFVDYVPCSSWDGRGSVFDILQKDICVASNYTFVVIFMFGCISEKTENIVNCCLVSQEP